MEVPCRGETGKSLSSWPRTQGAMAPSEVANLHLFIKPLETQCSAEKGQREGMWRD